MPFPGLNGGGFFQRVLAAVELYTPYSLWYLEAESEKAFRICDNGLLVVINGWNLPLTTSQTTLKSLLYQKLV